jgi:hypothetical protein
MSIVMLALVALALLWGWIVAVRWALRRDHEELVVRRFLEQVEQELEPVGTGRGEQGQNV